MSKTRKIHIAITVGISAIIVLLSGFAFQTSWLRLFETFRDFGVSVKYYFCKLFEIKTDSTPTVTDYSRVFAWNGFLPDSSQKANGYVKEFFALFFNADNFKAWLNGVTDGLYIFLKSLVLSLPCIVLIVILSQKLRQKRNNDYNEDTKPLKAYKAVENTVFVPVVRFVKAYIAFLKENIKVVYTWLILLAVMLNVASVFVAFFAYYFYFAVSFDVTNLWVQFGKLVIDLQVVVKTIPLIGVARNCLYTFQSLAEKLRYAKVAALRGEKLRVYKRIAYRVYDVRQYGKEKDDDYYGYGFKPRSNV